MSSSRLPAPRIDFVLPRDLEAGEPPEARGLARDEVRLLVSYRSEDRLVHTRFRALPELLSPGDVVVVNTSATLNAALPATRVDGTELELHLSTRLPGGLWVIELRRPDGVATQPFREALAGEALRLPDGGTVRLFAPYRMEGTTHHAPHRLEGTTHHAPHRLEGTTHHAPHRLEGTTHHAPQRLEGTDHDPPSYPSLAAGPARVKAAEQGVRLWLAGLEMPGPLESYLDAHGTPIRYGYVGRKWPLEYYQTVYANEPGSAEMPSAGRAFTHPLITRLVAKGVHVAPLVLHTGVASLEDHEPPYEEYYRVPLETARLINLAKAAGRRIVAVGTTVTRALETVADREGVIHPGEGWTRLVITPARGLRAVNALLTGLHEPKATHLMMLEALADPAHLRRAYQAALEGRYLWHEFGDLHLILP